MDWFALALLSAFVLATSDAFTKKLLRGYAARDMAVVYAVFTALCLVPWLILCWPEQIPAPLWDWIAAALPLEIAGMLLYYAALRDSPLALTVPYLAFTPALILVTGWVVLGELPTWEGGGGVLLVVAGAYLLNIEHVSEGGWMAPLKAIWREPGSRRMLGAAAIYSLTSVFGKGALQYVAPDFFGPFYFLVLGVATPLLLFVREPRALRVLVRQPMAHLFLGALGAAMVLTHFMSLALVETAYMIAVKRTSLLFAIIYGAVMFGERQLATRLPAGVLMVLGVALLAQH